MRNERGITLIALVVTIVVLLILAGVTITYALGDNGIFSTAKKAELGSVKATFSDAVSTTQAECLIKLHDPDDSVPTKSADLLAMVKNYLPDAWKTGTNSSDLTFNTTDESKPKNVLAGTITTTVNSKSYTITVANGIVTGVE